MDLRNNDDFTDLLAEDMNENYETSPLHQSQASDYWDGNLDANNDELDLVADE